MRNILCTIYLNQKPCGMLIGDVCGTTQNSGPSMLIGDILRHILASTVDIFQRILKKKKDLFGKKQLRSWSLTRYKFTTRVAGSRVHVSAASTADRCVTF